MLARARKVAREKAALRLCVVRHHQQRWAARLLGHRQRLIGERLRRLGPVAGRHRRKETVQQEHHLHRVAELRTEHPRPREGLGRLRRGERLGHHQRLAERELEPELLLPARRAVRQRRQHGQPAPEMAHRLAERPPPERSLARPLPGCHGGLRLPGLRIVVGEHLGLLRGDGGEPLGERPRDRAVEIAA
ncbi:MAG: hypothetical protein DMD34_02345, partial [Gemmatimonadetes bacterium]